MSNPSSPQLVSVHGAHSGEFCNHASDTLEEIIQAYIAKGFAWFGITEHTPPLDDSSLYPDELEAGLDAGAIQDRFRNYVATARELQKKYASSIDILVGFETEWYSGYHTLLSALIDELKPDYIVGSLHHTLDTPIDGTPELYAEAIDKAGDKVTLYCEYFDHQHDLIMAFQPSVVGHFDLIRIWDPDYAATLQHPDVWKRIARNLELIADLDLILDYNVRAFEKGIELLLHTGFDGKWKRPGV